MSIFKKIKDQISKRRKLPQKQVRVYVVPKVDYELLKEIRIAIGNGESLSLEASDNQAILSNNAWTLHKYYGMNVFEVAVETGQWVGEQA